MRSTATSMRSLRSDVVDRDFYFIFVVSFLVNIFSFSCLSVGTFQFWAVSWAVNQAANRAINLTVHSNNRAVANLRTKSITNSNQSFTGVPSRCSKHLWVQQRGHQAASTNSGSSSSCLAETLAHKHRANNCSCLHQQQQSTTSPEGRKTVVYYCLLF